MGTSVRAHYLTALQTEAKELGLDWKVLDALIHIESSWNPWACRYERQYVYTQTPEVFAKKARTTLSTENTLQKCSFGLMQVMGGTARWLGYTGPLTALCDPEVGIHWGAVFFKHLCSEYVNLNDQIAAYNAGAVRRKSDGSYQNQQYVDKVLDVLGTLL